MGVLQLVEIVLSLLLIMVLNTKSNMKEPKTTHVLFVCLGNICRSPAAQTVMEQLVADRGLAHAILCDSAGTYSGHTGEKADPRMRYAASRRGIDITHRARQVRSQDFDRFDMLVAMDDSNYDKLFRLAPTAEATDKIHRMCEFFGERFARDWDHVPDPYYEGSEGFELVLDMLEEGCANLLNELEAADKDK